MHQIRIHGRGGQGVVTAAELIAMAAFEDGKTSQAFPYFGVERTGAPIEAFARIDDKDIKLRERIYEPNVVIVQDPTLLGNPTISRGCDEKTIFIINTGKKINNKLCGKIFTVDATKIAMDIIGKNLVNTTILGAFAKVTNLISLKSLEAAIKKKFSGKDKTLIEKNIKAIHLAYNK